MKILELYLKAYGPFTERRIELGSGAPGLHVIFGRNEAGKSSALRAIHHLLYGIPARSSDDFLHDYPSMRIGGRLRDSDGRELAFLRKKGSKNTLRSWDDADAMDDATLEPFLRGVPDELFGSFFGIDHATLVEGGQSLLEEQGDLGKSLFAAGLGSGNLRKVISGLEDEAKALFAARASKPSINAGLARLKQIQSEIKQGALKPRDWEAHDSAFSEAEDELRGIQSELGGLRGEHNRLQRLGSVLPLLGQRRHALESIEAMGEVISLDEGFEERLQAALQTRRDQGEARSRALEAVDEIAKKLAELALDPALSQQREVVESFRERFGSYKTASAQLPRREGGRERLGEELAAALAALGTHVAVEQLDELRAPLARRRQIQELASEYGVLQTRAENALETLREGTGKQEAARAELAALPAVRDGAELGRVLAAARKLGDVDGQASSLALRCQRARRACHDDLAALGLWSGSLEELERAAIPALETLERFQGGFDALEKEREKLGAGRQKAADEIRDVDARLETLRGSGAVPSEEELAGERERRDAGWRLVRRRWVDASAPDTAVDVAEAEAASSGGAAPAHDTLDADISAFAGGDALPTAYEGSVASADETADRLRREADRVAAQAELLGRRGRAEQALEEAGNELTQVAERESTLAREWRDIWQTVQIEPNPPREMLAWLRRQQTLLGAAAEARKQEDALSELTGARASGRGALLASLRRLGEAVEGEAVEEGGEEETGEELADVVARADEMLQSIEALERRRRELDAALEEGERKLEAAANDEREAQERLSCWRDEWSVAVDGLGLSDGAHRRHAQGPRRVRDAARRLRRAPCARSRGPAPGADGSAPGGNTRRDRQRGSPARAVSRAEGAAGPAGPARRTGLRGRGGTAVEASRRGGLLRRCECRRGPAELEGMAQDPAARGRVRGAAHPGRRRRLDRGAGERGSGGRSRQPSRTARRSPGADRRARSDPHQAHGHTRGRARGAGSHGRQRPGRRRRGRRPGAARCFATGCRALRGAASRPGDSRARDRALPQGAPGAATRARPGAI
ncbi:MAG: AAA family ATPase [Deltaproteobacteria bacterium]|nr:AAA family ATPase [Deltaproteobacteria bacterium]